MATKPRRPERRQTGFSTAGEKGPGPSKDVKKTKHGREEGRKIAATTEGEP